MSGLKQFCKEECSRIPLGHRTGLMQSCWKQSLLMITVLTSYVPQGFTNFFLPHCECLMGGFSKDTVNYNCSHCVCLLLWLTKEETLVWFSICWACTDKNTYKHKKAKQQNNQASFPKKEWEVHIYEISPRLPNYQYWKIEMIPYRLTDHLQIIFLRQINAHDSKSFCTILKSWHLHIMLDLHITCVL